MHPECAWQLCGRAAVAVCAIDPPSTTVLLLPLDTSMLGSPLCGRHVDHLRPPAGWQLRDDRDACGPEPVDAADALHAAPARDDLESLLDARSPLLSRAFRTAGGD